jgi:hypothetical protein
MTAPEKREQLNRRFRNGSMPSQADFDALMASFVHKDELREWTPRVIEPENPTNGNEPSIWLSIAARFGAHRDPNASRHQLDHPLEGGPPHAIGNVLADENWHTLLHGGETCGAYELVIQTSDGDSADTFVRRVMHRLGFAPPKAGVIHAIAVTAGRGERPTLRATIAPHRGFPWGRTIAAILAATGSGFTLRPEILLAVPASLAGVAAGIAASAFAIRHAALTLAWRRNPDSKTYSLSVRSATRHTSGIFYHVTRLW